MKALAPFVVLALLAGCGPTPAPPVKQSATAPNPIPPSVPKPSPRLADVDRINQAPFNPTPPEGSGSKTAVDLSLVRAQVLLARAHFSPGAVDGRLGTNLKHALSAFQTAHNLDASGELDQPTWQALLAQGGAPVAKTYKITQADVAGPFAPDVGEDFVKLAALPDGPQFSSVVEALAEKFHMSQDLLKSLNPAIDFTKPDQDLVVIDAEGSAFQKGDVKSITVSKALEQVVALDADNKVLAVYPATVGSTERPSPSGVHKINGVARHPDYVYDPSKLHWGPRSHGKLVIKPGPNNPVGVVWIDLNAPSYGIHGSPDPEKIGKTASHGCVRLTNWDAEALAAGVRPGVLVTFEGRRGRTS